MSLDIETQALVVHGDEGGRLIKAWPGPVAGEVYTVDLKPGQPRGNHLHIHGGEWFVVLSGRALLVVADPATGEHRTLRLDGIRARVEAGQAHALHAVGGPALVLAIADLVHPLEGTEPWTLPAPDAILLQP